MGIDQKRDSLRAEEARHRQALEARKATVQNIADQVLAGITASIANSSAAGRYIAELQQAPGEPHKAQAGVIVRRTGQVFGTWSLWISAGTYSSVNVQFGGVDKSYHEPLDERQIVKEAIEDAEARLAFDLERNRASPRGGGRFGCMIAMLAVTSPLVALPAYLLS